MNRPGRWKNGYACRCNNRACRAYGQRVHLNLHPDHYAGTAHAKRAICPSCNRTYSVDWHRTTGKEQQRQRTCSGPLCNHHFPHRYGSAGCEHSEYFLEG